MKTTESFEHNFMRLTSCDYIIIYDWMGAEGGLNLKPAELRVFSLIYSYSGNGDLASGANYRGSIDYAMSRLNLSKQSVITALKSLIAKKLIVLYGYLKGSRGRKRAVYVTNPEEVQKAQRRFEEYWDAAGKARPHKLEDQDIELVMAPFGNDKPLMPEQTEGQLNLLTDLVANEENCDDPSDLNVKKFDLCFEDEMSKQDEKPQNTGQNDQNMVKKLDQKADNEKNCLNDGTEKVKKFDQNPVEKVKKFDPDNINNNLNNQPSNNNNLPSDQIGRTDGSIAIDEAELNFCFSALKELANNHNLLETDDGISQTKQALRMVLHRGIKSDQIIRAWKSLTTYERDQRRNPQFCKQLRRWLSNDALKMVPDTGNTVDQKSVKPSEEDLRELLKNTDAKYAALTEAYVSSIQSSIKATLDNPREYDRLRQIADENKKVMDDYFFERKETLLVKFENERSA